MIRRTVLIATLLSAASALPAHGQAEPTAAVDPASIELGGTTTVMGAGFEPGTVRIYLDGVTGTPLAERPHRGEFNFLVEISGVTPDVHELIACNNQSRTGECREQAITALVVLPPATTSTVPAGTTTTTVPAGTTTTVGTRPSTTSTSPPTTGRVTASPSFTTAPTTVSAASASTTSPVVDVATTNAPTDLVGATSTSGVPIPSPTGVQTVATTAPAFDLSTSDDLDWPDLEVLGFEVTQGIQDLQNRMPLVAERPTWVRLYVAVDRLPADADGDALTTGAVGSEWSYAGWPDVTGALLLEHGSTVEVRYPENGPITAYGDGGDRLVRDATLNFLLPHELTVTGELEITAFVWSQLPGTPISQEPDPANNYASLTVDFHVADEPTLFAARLRNEDVWSAVSPAMFDVAVSQIEESLLTFHPISGTTVSQMLFLVDPGPEVSEDEDPDGNWDLDERGWEPNTRLGWYHALWDAADDEWFVGVAPANASAEWSGWANPGSHAFWTKGSTTTPAHEMGHAQGLLHVPCKDTSEPLGVPDELAGGSLDLAHPTGLPNCSLAPVDPDGYVGFTTLDELPSIYSNDPDALGARFPFMSYRNPEWTDPFHTCLLLDSYGVPCDPASIGVPPLPAVADLGQVDTVVLGPPDTGTWEPVLPGDPHEGPIALFELTWEACDTGAGAPSETVCDDASGGDGTTEQFFTIEIDEGQFAPGHSECEGSTTSGSGAGPATTSPPPPTTAPAGAPYPRYVLSSCLVTSFAEIGPAMILEQPTSGARGLLERQLLLTGAPTPSGGGVVDGADFNDVVWQGGWGTTPPSWVVVSDSSGSVPGRVMPLALDGLGHGGGVEVSSEASLVAAPWHDEYDSIRIVGADGVVLDTLTTTGPPTVTIDEVEVVGRDVRVAWTGDDPDGDELLYDLSISPDGGATWRPLAVLTDATDFVVTDDHRVAGGDQVVLRVTATDGLATSSVESGPFPVPDASPIVTISAAPSTLRQHSARTLTASAHDPEDGVIEAISWSSSLDGDLGTGRRVGTRWLSLGTHEVTVSVQDSTGATAIDTLVLEVVDDGRARPMMEGDLPEVDALLRAAAGIGDPPVVAAGASAEPTAPPSDDVRELAPGADRDDRPGSNVGLALLMLAGVGVAGVGLGATARRRGSGAARDGSPTRREELS